MGKQNIINRDKKLKKYSVTLHYHTNLSVEVHANDEKHAIMIARLMSNSKESEKHILLGLQENKAPDVEPIMTKSMGKKVYVLICESVSDGVQKITTKVFSKRSKVHKEMRECYNNELEDWKHSYGNACVSIDKGDNSRGIWLNSSYESNHIIWLIEEQGVIE